MAGIAKTFYPTAAEKASHLAFPNLRLLHTFRTMESLSDTKWDVVISGTGLQQSLLALALSRSGQNILHVDSNEYYGGPQAALSLQDADEWVEKHAGIEGAGPFASAQAVKEHEGLGSPRSYSIALAPQLIHTRSELLSQLVSSKAFRQIEFLAVGSFFIYQTMTSDTSTRPVLSRIPSTREDVFSNTAIPARSKRLLMKFLKFVLEFDSEPQVQLWKQKESQRLDEFLETEFKLDHDLRSYVITLTLSLDGMVPVGPGLAAIHRHLTSMGVLGSGFAAVYPKWGGLSEIAQVACRAGAVGGAIYMLGVGISGHQKVPSEGQTEIEVGLTNDITVRTKSLICGRTRPTNTSTAISRLVAIVNSSLSSMFEVVAEGAPTPCAAVVAFPAGSVSDADGSPSESPIYALVHSSDTGECPTGQCTVYLSTPNGSKSKSLLENALSSFLAATSEKTMVTSLWRLHYEQSVGAGSFTVLDNIGTFDWLPSDLAFNDSVLAPVEQAWKMVAAEDQVDSYMKFEDREGVNDDDDPLNT